MSGIVGGINLRSSGLVNLGSSADGEVFTGAGLGLPVGFEEAAGGGVGEYHEWYLSSQYYSGSTGIITITSNQYNEPIQWSLHFPPNGTLAN